MITRATLFTDKGGDTVQVVNTAENLRRLGVGVDIRLTNEKIDYTSYDLVHFFNIIRPADILGHLQKTDKPYVISTIYVDYSEFEKRARKGWMGLMFRVLPGGWIEYLKVIARALFNGEKIGSLEYLWKGHNLSVKKLICGSALLLPNSNSEYRRLARDFGISHPYKMIPNAIDPGLFAGHDKVEEDKTLVLCIGRIEGRKNQLNLIRALNETRFQLYIIGAAAKNQPEYYLACKTEARNNIYFIERLPQEELLDYYNRAVVHVLPSWFETTGLSSLEAAAMGCNIVITDKGDTREYFEDMAYYCDPSDPDSIRRAVELAAEAPVNERLRKKVREEYNWQVAALKTLEAYQSALTKNNT